jgi:peptide chain release factor subunit 1
MLTMADIEKLERFDTRGARVLSVFLHLDPSRHIRRSYVTAFDDLVKEAREHLEDPLRSQLRREAAAVRVWLENERPRGKALALFACSGRGLMTALALSVRVDDHIAFDETADVAPLLEVLDEHELYTVALVDKQRARLFTVVAGAIEESVAFTDDVPGRHAQGGLSQPCDQRHHDAHVNCHLKRVIRHLQSLHRSQRFDRLIIAGPKEATSELRRLLNATLAHRLVAVIPAAIDASPTELLARTLDIERRIERGVETRLFDELMRASTSKDSGALGITATLDALWMGDVQTLIVAEGLRLSGVECSNCGRLDASSRSRCPACQSLTRETHDLVHRAMARTREQGGRVEVFHDDLGTRLMQNAKGLAALLRFKAPLVETHVGGSRAESWRH